MTETARPFARDFASSKTPLHRLVHENETACEIDQEVLLVVGGYSGNTRFDDVWRWSPEEFSWTSLPVQGAFTGRAGHVMARLGGDSMVFGLG